MRILLASEYFYPVTKGGTEMYVYQLAKELIAHGYECAVLSMSDDKKEDVYEGIPIYYIPFVRDTFQEVVHPDNFDALRLCIENYKPDVFHLHTSTPSLGVNHLEKIATINIKIVFTAHLTSFTCLRGDLMLYGKEVCDGALNRNRCLDCYLSSQGYHNTFQRAVIIQLSKLPLLKTIYAPLNVYDQKKKSLDKFKKVVDKLVLVSNWQKSVMEINNFEESKLAISRQAINKRDILDQKKITENKLLKIGFVGRVVRLKGLHILLDVFNGLNTDNAELHIAAIQSKEELDYYMQVKHSAEKENIIWKENLSASEVFAFLDSIDLLAVPSTWLETGPYVIFEAMARKVPVISFNKGGAVELINNNINGWLVENELEFRWKLEELMTNKEMLKEASLNIKKIRTTEDLFEEMVTVYNSYKD